MSKTNQGLPAPLLRRRLHCATRGPGDAPPIVLVHDLGQSHETWDEVVDELEDRFRVIAPDLPGHGKSASRRDECTLRAAALTLAGVIDSNTARRPVVVGQGLGALIATELAILRKGELLAGVVAVCAERSMRRGSYLPHRDGKTHRRWRAAEAEYLQRYPLKRGLWRCRVPVLVVDAPGGTTDLVRAAASAPCAGLHLLTVEDQLRRPGTELAEIVSAFAAAAAAKPQVAA